MAWQPDSCTRQAEHALPSRDPEPQLQQHAGGRGTITVATRDLTHPLCDAPLISRPVP